MIDKTYLRAADITPESTRADVEAAGYYINNGGTILTPGKFEAEAWYAPIVYAMLLDGWGEDYTWPDETCYSIIYLDDPLRVRLGLQAEDHALLCYESGQGFFFVDVASEKETLAYIDRYDRAWDEENASEDDDYPEDEEESE